MLFLALRLAAILAFIPLAASPEFELHARVETEAENDPETDSGSTADRDSDAEIPIVFADEARLVTEMTLDSEVLDARFRYEDLLTDTNPGLGPSDLPRTGPDSDYRLGIQSPFISAGALEPAGWWSSLSSFRFDLNPDSPRDSTKILSLLAFSDPTRYWGFSLALPHALSLSYFQALKGSFEGFRHGALIGELWLPDEALEGSGRIAGLPSRYFYHVGLFASGLFKTGGAKDLDPGSGLVVHERDEWWSDDAFSGPSRIFHGQIGAGVFNSLLSLNLVSQLSFPLAWENLGAGYFGTLGFSIPRVGGKRFFDLSLEFAGVDRLYVDQHGEYPDFSHRGGVAMTLSPANLVSVSANFDSAYPRESPALGSEYETEPATEPTTHATDFGLLVSLHRGSRELHVRLNLSQKDATEEETLGQFMEKKTLGLGLGASVEAELGHSTLADSLSAAISLGPGERTWSLDEDLRFRLSVLSLGARLGLDGSLDQNNSSPTLSLGLRCGTELPSARRAFAAFVDLGYSFVPGSATTKEKKSLSLAFDLRLTTSRL